MPKPTDEVRIEDLKNKNFSTFTYNKESDIPDIFKDKITSKKAIKFAYQISTGGRHLITMPEDKKIKLTAFPLKIS